MSMNKAFVDYRFITARECLEKLVEGFGVEVVQQNLDYIKRLDTLRTGMCPLCGWKLFADGTCCNEDCANGFFHGIEDEAN